MATKKLMYVLFGILALLAWVLGPVIPAGAETMSYKLYSVVIKSDSFPIGDVEGHDVVISVRSAFYVFPNEVATAYAFGIRDAIKEAGSFSQYVTLTFPDGSTIIRRDQGTRTGAESSYTSEIIKGTGRFEGIKGTHTAKSKYLPVEKWEAGPKVIGEGTYTYTLPSK